MPEKLKTALSRGGISLLLSMGLALPVLFTLSLGDYWLMMVGTVVGVTAVLCGASLNKWGKWILLTGGITFVAVDYMVTAGRLAATVIQVFQAMFLQLAGQVAALPLYGTECAIIVGCIFAFAGYMLCSPNAGFFPAVTISLAVLMMLWIAGRQELLIYCLPTLCALVIMYAKNRHDDLPIKRILPLAILAVLLAFFLVPGDGVVAPQMQQAATDVRQRIKDYLFFTEPRNVFSLATEGYYPQGAQQLGGPATPTDHPVMRVITDQKVLLRGTIKDFYNGRVWENTTGGRRYLYISPRWRQLRTTLLNMDLPKGALAEAQSLLKESTVTIYMLSPNASTLFTPQRVRKLDMTTGDAIPYFNNASELYMTRDLETDDSYNVTALLMQAGDPGLGTLVTACQTTEDQQYASLYGTYTALPNHLDERVYQLAQRITANYETPYDKALAIQNYLSRYYNYNLNVEVPSDDYDFVSYFLLMGKEGYCTYFASAMTVLSRMAGLPARYVEGYLAQPDGNGVAYVTGLNGHAWTEVYFEGFGWLAFDPTPSQNGQGEEETPPEPDDDNSGGEETSPSPEPENEPTPSPDPNAVPSPEPEEEPSPEPENEPTPSPEPQETPQPEGQDDEPEPDEPKDLTLLWIILATALVIAACALRIWYTSPKVRANHAKDNTGKVMAWSQAVFDLMRTHKIQRGSSETLLAFGARLDGEAKLPLSITPLCEVISLCCYSPHPMETEDVDIVQSTFKQMFEKLPWYKKVYLAVYRAIVPKKRADFT